MHVHVHVPRCLATTPLTTQLAPAPAAHQAWASPPCTGSSTRWASRLGLGSGLGLGLGLGLALILPLTLTLTLTLSQVLISLQARFFVSSGLYVGLRLTIPIPNHVSLSLSLTLS